MTGWKQTKTFLLVSQQPHHQMLGIKLLLYSAGMPVTLQLLVHRNPWHSAGHIKDMQTHIILANTAGCYPHMQEVLAKPLEMQLSTVCDQLEPQAFIAHAVQKLL